MQVTSGVLPFIRFHFPSFTCKQISWNYGKVIYLRFSGIKFTTEGTSSLKESHKTFWRKCSGIFFFKVCFESFLNIFQFGFGTTPSRVNEILGLYQSGRKSALPIILLLHPTEHYFGGSGRFIFNKMNIAGLAGFPLTRGIAKTGLMHASPAPLLQTASAQVCTLCTYSRFNVLGQFRK